MTQRNPPGSDPVAVEALAEAMTDPVRFKVVSVIAEDPGLTISQIADRVREAPRRVRYQVDVLRKAGLVKISGQETRRGAIEHRYSLTRPMVLTGEEYDSLATGLKSGAALGVFRRVLDDVVAATSAGTFGIRSGHAEIRCVGEVDEAGWETLAQISITYYREIQHVLDEAEKRAKGSGEAGIAVTAALFLLDRPSRSTVR
jgi:DNA-binding transcriptional ArsR family regulator